MDCYSSEALPMIFHSVCYEEFFLWKEETNHACNKETK